MTQIAHAIGPIPYRREREGGAAMSDEQQFLSEEEEIDQALNSKYTVVLDVFLRPNIATGALAESLIQCLSVVHDAGEVVRARDPATP
jgi:hypothetical protein